LLASMPPASFFFQAEDGIRDFHVTGVQTCALPISHGRFAALTTRPAPSLGFQVEGAQRVRDVDAVVLSQHFLWVPTRSDPPTLAEAIEAALRRGNGELLVDVEVDRRVCAIPHPRGHER